MARQRKGFGATVKLHCQRPTPKTFLLHRKAHTYWEKIAVNALQLPSANYARQNVPKILCISYDFSIFSS